MTQTHKVKIEFDFDFDKDKMELFMKTFEPYLEKCVRKVVDDFMHTPINTDYEIKKILYKGNENERKFDS